MTTLCKFDEVREVFESLDEMFAIDDDAPGAFARDFIGEKPEYKDPEIDEKLQRIYGRTRNY